jgi:hypothetical protein
MAIATALAIGGLAVSAASTTASFIQAGQQKKKQREAEAKAAEAMAEARKKLEVNFAKNLSIQKEPFELEREAMLSQGALALQAGVESDRGAEATAGRVQMAQNVGQAGVRSAMGKELMGIEQQIVNEDSRLRDIGVQLDLGEVEGAQLAARDAQEARAAAMAQGFEGLTSLGQQALNLVPLYQKTAEARNMQKLNLEAQPIIDRQNFQQKINLDAANQLAGLGANNQLLAPKLNTSMQQLYAGLGF